MLSHVYGQAVRWRRSWYARHPQARRRLARPVISVGNLTVGGSGKTPCVAHVTRLLLAEGERPAILSRGYARRVAADGVVVVSDGTRLRADLDRSGDEPLMLARGLPDAAVLVSSDRYLAGRLAERRLGCTVHVLDDGFQHLGLQRDLDLLLLGPRDVDEGQVLPRGRLREPPTAAGAADALIVTGGTETEAEGLAARLGVAQVFTMRGRQELARLVEPSGQPVEGHHEVDAIAVAGIARPDRFFADLRSAGWALRRTITFRDHHAYSTQDVERLAGQVRADGVDLVVTTEKDLMRLLPHRPLPFPLAWVPLTVEVEPADRFESWLTQRLAAARARSPAPDVAAAATAVP